ISMGAAAICFAGAKIPFYRAFVLESMYHDLAAAFVNRVGAVFPAWFHRFRRGIIWLTERRLGARLAEVAPAAHIGELAPRPILLVTGNRDRYAPPEDQLRLYEQCRAPTERCLVPGAAHMDVCALGGAM